MVSDLCMILSVNKHSKIDTNAIIDKAKKRYFSSTPLPSPFGGGAQSVGVVAPLAAGRSPTEGVSGCSRGSGCAMRSEGGTERIGDKVSLFGSENAVAEVVVGFFQ